jgi:hypothetical protein
MPVQPLSTWQKRLDEVFQETMKNQAKDKNSHIKAWQNWIGEVSTGISAAAPHISSGTTDKTMFAPLKFPKKSKPETAAIVFSNAWLSWYSGIKWTVSPPAPPFSVVTAIQSSPSGAGMAKAKLQSQLTAEFKKKTKDPKMDKIAKYFYDATISAGVMITGIALVGSPPPPLVVPLHKVL